MSSINLTTTLIPKIDLNFEYAMSIFTDDIRAIQFNQIGKIAKIIGAVTILIPGLKKIKEWAYAGLFFDLAGAIYSIIATSPSFDPKMLGMLIWIVMGILSYYFWNKKSAA